MRENVKEAFRLIKKNMGRLIAFEIFFKLAFVVAVWPFCSLLWRVALNISGIGYVSVDRVTKAMVNPLLIVTVVLIGLILAFTLIFEISALITSFKYSYYEKDISFTQLTLLAMKKTGRLFKPHNIFVVIVGVCFLCFMNFFMASSVVKTFKIPEYIELYIESHTILNTALDIVYVLIFLINIAFIFIFNFFFCGNENGAVAAKNSAKLLKGRIKKVFGSVVVMKIIWSVFIGIVFAIIGIIYILVLAKFNKNNAVVAGMWTLYIVFKPLLTGVLSSCCTFMDFALITVMYYKYRKEDGNEEVQTKEDIRDNWIVRKVGRLKKPILIFSAVGGIIAVGIIFVTGFIIFRYNIYDELYSPIEVTAHRGNSTVAVPNTVPAFREAIKEGADYGELDVRQTRDNVIVVTHDASIAEMTGQDINVRDLTYEQLKKIPCKVVEGKNCHIAKLEDIIDVCKGKIKLNIEIKTGNNDSEDFVPSVVKIIENKGFEKDCVVTSLDYSALKKVKAVNNKLKTGYIMAVAMGEFYDLPDVDFFSMETTFVNQRVVDRAHKLNKEVHVWTANSYESLEKCVELDVDNIITDNVPDAKSVIASHGDDWFSIILEEIKDAEETQSQEPKNEINEDATGVGAA